MKLLHCTSCGDIVALDIDWKECHCSISSGQYMPDKLHVKVSGPVVVLGMRNSDLDDLTPGKEHPWWVIDEAREDCHVIREN